MEKIEFDYSKYDFKNSTAKYKIIFNEGFSGGEKKRFELLQVMLLKPKIAILDE